MSSTWVSAPVPGLRICTVPRRSEMNMVPSSVNSIAVGAVSPVATAWASKPVGTWMLTAVPPNCSSKSPSGWPVAKTSSKRASCSAASSLLTSVRSDSHALVMPPGMLRPPGGVTTMSVSPGFRFVLKRASYFPPASGWTVR